jgi:hypothetical protein
MTRTRILRLLRTAVSVVCLIICVAFAALWLRSYYALDELIGPISSSRWLGCGSTNGRLSVNLIHDSQWTPPTQRIWKHNTYAPESVYPKGVARPTCWEFKFTPNYIFVPHWFPITLLGILGFVSWRGLPTRFSLRAILVIMTLVAVVLGLVVAMR